MKKIISALIILAAFISTEVKAQQEIDLSAIALSVNRPTSTVDLNESGVSRLESKMTEIVTANGIAATPYSQSFMMDSKFEVYGSQATAGGMRSITVADCNLALFIKQIGSDKTFASFNRTIKGSGYNKNEAVMDAISKINGSDADVAKFINDGKQKIITYYNNNCNQIMQEAEAQVNTKQFEKALANLLSIPLQCEKCYATAQSKAKIVFDELQKQKCAEYIQQASALATGNNFSEALRIINQVDPTGPCKEQVEPLLKSWETKVDEVQKRDIDTFLKVYEGEVDIAKSRSRAMSNIVTLWLLNQSKKSNSNVK